MLGIVTVVREGRWRRTTITKNVGKISKDGVG